MSEYRDYSCKVCGISCNSCDQLRMHMSSIRHIRRCERPVSESESDLTTRLYYPPVQTTPEPDVNLTECFLCNVKLPSCVLISHECASLTIKEHYSDDVISKNKLSEIFPADTNNVPNSPKSKKYYDCYICNTTLNSQEQYNQHISGKKHAFLAQKANFNIENENPQIPLENNLTRKQSNIKSFCGILSNEYNSVKREKFDNSTTNIDTVFSSTPPDLVLLTCSNKNFPSNVLVRKGSSKNRIIECQVCNTSVPEKSMHAHVNGKCPLLKQQSVRDTSTPEYGSSILSDDSNADSYQVLNDPDYKLNAKENLDAETYLGKKQSSKHKTIECSICNTFFPEGCLPLHVRGKSHLRKMFLKRENTESKNNDSLFSALNEKRYYFQRKFNPWDYALYINNDIVVANDQMINLMDIGETDEDSLVILETEKQINFGSLTNLHLLIANRFADELNKNINSPNPELCYTAWLCDRKQDVIYIASTLRRFSSCLHLPQSPDVETEKNNFRPIRLAVLLSDFFSIDAPDLPIYEHDIILSTTGGFKNFLIATPLARFGLCSIIISGVESATKNHVTDSFIKNFTCDSSNQNNRARIICLCKTPPPTWSIVKQFKTFTF